MNKLKLGIDSSTTCLLHDILQNEYDITFNPIICTHGGDIEINIDIFLLIDGHTNDYSNDIIKHCDLSKIPVMGFNRLNKSLQYHYLKAFDINSPKTYFYYQDNKFKMRSENLINLFYLCTHENMSVLPLHFKNTYETHITSIRSIKTSGNWYPHQRTITSIFVASAMLCIRYIDDIDL